MPPTHEGTTEPDRAAYERLAEIVAVLASPVRLQILESLAQCPRSVEALAGVCGHPLKNVSHHLQKLRAAGFVTRSARGRKALYALAGGQVPALWSQLTAFANTLDAGNDGGGRERLPRAVLQRLLEEDRVTVIDVRPAEEYAAGHVPGALSLPFEQLAARIGELPRDRLIAAICRGPYCRLADEAVSFLSEGGRSAVRVEGGMLGWQGEGRALDEA